MKDQWLRIERWLSEHAPEVLASLNPPATLHAVREAERILDCKLPNDVVDSFLVHDGERDGKGGLWNGWELLCLEGVIRQWTAWRQLVEDGSFDRSKSRSDGDISEQWYDLGWIPLTYDGSGDHDCLDLNPGTKGTQGQIIRMNHDDPNRWVVAPSYRRWFTTFADDLEAGRFELNEDGFITRVEDEDAIDPMSPAYDTIWTLDNDASAVAGEYLEHVIRTGNVDLLADDLRRIIEPPMVQPGFLAKAFGARAMVPRPDLQDIVRAIVTMEIVAEALRKSHPATPSSLKVWIGQGREPALRELLPAAQKTWEALGTMACSRRSSEVQVWEWSPAVTALKKRLQIP